MAAASAGFIAWFTVMGMGLVATMVLDLFCPPELTWSGGCDAPWYEPAFDTLLALFAGLSAIAVVLVPPLVVPDQRRLAATVAFASGAGFASLFLAEDLSGVWIPWLVSILAGGAALRFAFRVWPSQPRDQSNLHR